MPEGMMSRNRRAAPATCAAGNADGRDKVFHIIHAHQWHGCQKHSRGETARMSDMRFFRFTQVFWKPAAEGRKQIRGTMGLTIDLSILFLVVESKICRHIHDGDRFIRQAAQYF